MSALLLTLSASAQPGNIARDKPVTAIAGTFNGPPLSTITDGQFLQEYTNWQEAVWWNGTAPTLEIDLQGSHLLTGAIIQADNNDTYRLDFRRLSDGAWLTLWDIPAVGGWGMQTRPTSGQQMEAYTFPQPITTDRIRLRATGGDNSYSISELQIFDATLRPPARQWARALNNAVQVFWQPIVDHTGSFHEYRIYRSTQPFTTVAGMMPIASVPSIEASTFTDTTAINGTSYHYAITTAAVGGGEVQLVTSVGPRTPRDETDLQVISFTRLPRFDRYAPHYTGYNITEPSGFGPYHFSAATGLGHGQTASTPRWPAIGAPVTYEARVRNRGTNTWVGTLEGEWRVNDVIVSTPTEIVSLQPDEVVVFTLPQTWDDQIHAIKFSILNPDARPENNSITGGSKSVGFLTYIDRSFVEDFRERTTTQYPTAETDDIFDWLNRHMARFNEMFEAAGTAKRVHYDILEAIPDAAPDPSGSTLPFAIFPFRYRVSDTHPRQASAYWRSEDDIDYGLLHEMGHQLGLIDIYQFDLPPQDNLASGRGYVAPDCLMRNVASFISVHSANAMNHWLHKAHGYYGQYLYATPENIRMRFLGYGGLPLNGATVTMYQLIDIPGTGKRIPNQAKFQGQTDPNGYLTLPNVPIDQSLVPTTAAGDTLHPNPFGYLAVVGTNGLLHFKIEHDGFTDYAWLDIVEVNNAYHAGQTGNATFDKQVNLGGPIQRFPPPDLAELNSASWEAWAASATASAHDDQILFIAGQASIRMETDGGYDTFLRYPADRLASWDLLQVQTIRFWARAANPNIGFQEGPRVRLLSGDGWFEWAPPGWFLNQAIGNWVEYTVPIAGDATWVRSSQGSPSLADINGIQIHADTWGYGFTLWVDGVRFDPPLCYPNCDGSTGTPILTVDDFTCFINAFAAASTLPHEQQIAHYANCDGNTTPPILTVDDFTCFINAFAAGCP